MGLLILYLLRVGNQILDLLSLLEGVVGGKGNGEQVPEAADHSIRNGSHGGVTNLKGNSGDVGNTLGELGEDVLVGNVQQRWRVDSAIVEDQLDAQAVLEGLDTQHLKKGGLRSSDLSTFLDKVDIVDDFNRTLGDLGLNGEGLEERGLGGILTSRTSRDNHIARGNGASLGGGFDLVGANLGSDIGQIGIGEEETNVTLDVGKKGLKASVLGQMLTNALPDHGVLTHEQNSAVAEVKPHALKLLAAYIVGRHNHNLPVLSKEGGQTTEVLLLPCQFRTAALGHFDSKVPNKDLRIWPARRKSCSFDEQV